MINVEELKDERDRLVELLNQYHITKEEQKEIFSEITRLEKLGLLEVVLDYGDDFMVINTFDHYDPYQIIRFHYDFADGERAVEQERVFLVAKAVNKSGRENNVEVFVHEDLYDISGEQVTDNAVIEWYFQYEK